MDMGLDNGEFDSMDGDKSNESNEVEELHIISSKKANKKKI